MIELPEASNLARQLRQTVTGKRVADVVANQSPHKWAWFHGDPATYAARMAGLEVRGASAHGGMVELDLGSRLLVYGDGVSARFHSELGTVPRKHQLLVVFDDGSALCSSVQMYGGLWCWDADAVASPYYWQARQKPSPLSAAFDAAYFAALTDQEAVQRKSVKALLATEQRIPGLGNGVLQDILLDARLHPKRPVASLDADQRDQLHQSVVRVLTEMTRQGGRDTEKDLCGAPGGYRTVLSRNTVGGPCPACGTAIRKESYLGGSVYYCPHCQPL